MSRNGSGTYTLPAGNPVSTGTTISSSWANTTLSDIATALTQSIAYNGVTTPIANLPMGGYKLTNLGVATTSGDALSYGNPITASTISATSVSANLTFDGNNLVLSTSSSSDAFRITQTGAGNAFVVEDSTNPDSTPFVIDGDGVVITGATQSYTVGGVTTTRLQIHGITQGPASQGIVNWGATITAPLLTTAKSRSGTIGTHTIVQSGDSLGAWIAQGSNGTSFLTATSIYAQVDGTPATNSMPSRLVFSTTADGASSPTERMRIDSSGNVLIGLTSATSGGAKLQTVDGITFPATQVASSNANTLDDYEEGTFTPTIVGTTTAGTGTYSVQVGRYTKVGNRVFFTVKLTWSAHTGTGNIRISSLPFTSSSATNVTPTLSILASNLTFSNQLSAYVVNNSTQAELSTFATGAANAAVAMDTAAQIEVAGHYEV